MGGFRELSKISDSEIELRLSIKRRREKNGVKGDYIRELED